MKKSILLMLVFITFCLHVNASVFKPKQIKNLQLVKKIALLHKNKKGETFENTAMAISLTETQAGMMKVGDVGKSPNIFHSSLGIMQVRLQTARFIAKKLKLNDVLSLSDIDLVNKLLSDDEFNITIAIKYFVWLSDHTKTYFQAISRYNGGNVNYKYFNRVMKNMKKLKQNPF